jgi:hypothetical protein
MHDENILACKTGLTDKPNYFPQIKLRAFLTSMSYSSQNNIYDFACELKMYKGNVYAIQIMANHKRLSLYSITDMQLTSGSGD